MQLMGMDNTDGSPKGKRVGTRECSPLSRPRPPVIRSKSGNDATGVGYGIAKYAVLTPVESTALPVISPLLFIPFALSR